MLQLTFHQMNKIESNYVIPYVDLVKFTLEDLPVDQSLTLYYLLSLIAKDKSEYNEETLNLDIRETIEQEDVFLKIGIQGILHGASLDQCQDVYKALYTLFHEVRLNKSPDSPHIDDQNAVAIVNDNNVYSQTVTKVGQLSTRIVEKWEKNLVQAPSNEAIENAVLSVLKKILASLDIRKENTASEKVAAPETVVPKTTINQPPIPPVAAPSTLLSPPPAAHIIPPPPAASARSPITLPPPGGPTIIPPPPAAPAVPPIAPPQSYRFKIFPLMRYLIGVGIVGPIAGLLRYMINAKALLLAGVGIGIVSFAFPAAGWLAVSGVGLGCHAMLSLYQTFFFNPKHRTNIRPPDTHRAITLLENASYNKPIPNAMLWGFRYANKVAGKDNEPYGQKAWHFSQFFDKKKVPNCHLRRR